MALGIWLYVLPPSVAVPLVLICSVSSQISTLPTMWKVLDFKLAAPFVIGGLAGMPIGALLVAQAEPQVFKLSVGVMLLAFPAALFFIRKPMAIRFGGRPADAAVGFAGGILGGLAGLSGPLPTLWASIRGWTKDQRRGVFQIFNGTVLGAALILQIASGFVKTNVFWLAMLAMPGTLIGARLGMRTYHALNDRNFYDVVLALLIVLRRKLPPRALWPQLVITMLCVAFLFPLLMSLGMQRVDASHGGVVLGVLPIATALVAVAITHERPRPLFWVASVAGAALVIAFALRQGGGTLAAGDLFLFASVAVAAIGYAFSGRLTSQMPGWEVISWVLVIALPLSIPAAALTMPAGITHIALKPWLGLLYVALFSQWIGFFAWNAGLAMGGIARVSQIQLLQPFVTFALAAFFNDETITLQILLFATAVVVTVAISTRTRASAAPAPPQRDREPPQLAAS